MRIIRRCRRIPYTRITPWRGRRWRWTRTGPIPSHASRVWALVPAYGGGQLAGVGTAAFTVRFGRGIRGRWPRAAARIPLASAKTTSALLVVIVVISTVDREETCRVGRWGNWRHVIAVGADALRARTAIPLGIRRTRRPCGRVGVGMGAAVMRENGRGVPRPYERV